MNYVSSDAELTEFWAFLRLLEYCDKQSRSEDSSVLMEGILNLIDYVVQEVVNVVLLPETIEENELANVRIKALSEFVLKSLDLSLWNWLFDCELGWRFRNVAFIR